MSVSIQIPQNYVPLELDAEYSTSLFFKDTLLIATKDIIKTSSFSFLDYIISGKAGEIIADKFGFGLGRFIPLNWKTKLLKVETKLAFFNNSIARIFCNNNEGLEILARAACEEVENRWLIQEIILRRLPKHILKKISPELEQVVDTLPFRVSRVALSALIFAICHAHNLDSEGGCIPQLIGGLVYGGFYEATGSLALNISAHVFYNLFDIYFSQT